MIPKWKVVVPISKSALILCQVANQKPTQKANQKRKSMVLLKKIQKPSHLKIYKHPSQFVLSKQKLLWLSIFLQLALANSPMKWKLWIGIIENTCKKELVVIIILHVQFNPSTISIKKFPSLLKSLITLIMVFLPHLGILRILWRNKIRLNMKFYKKISKNLLMESFLTFWQTHFPAFLLIKSRSKFIANFLYQVQFNIIFVKEIVKKMLEVRN